MSSSNSCAFYSTVVYTDLVFFFFQAEDGIRDLTVTGVQTCALPIFERQHLVGDRAHTPLLGQDKLTPGQLNGDDVGLARRRAREQRTAINHITVTQDRKSVV